MKKQLLAVTLISALSLAPLFAEIPEVKGQNATGSVTASGTVNMTRLANASGKQGASVKDMEANPLRLPFLHPAVRDLGSTPDAVAATARIEATSQPTPQFRGWNALSHLDQRTARNGNQFSTEPPDQGLAVGNGFVLEAVNSALNVYDTNGVQQLVHPVALSEFFGLPPAINRNTGFFGVFPGDVSAQYDPETQRFFVIAFAQLNDRAGKPRPQSRLYIAVSQTSDPTGAFSIYVLDTTGAREPDLNGPRIPDFPHFAVDHFGIYISFNEFGIDPITAGPTGFINAVIVAISKDALLSGSGGVAPPVVRFPLPFTSGYEFTVCPAQPSPDTGPVRTNGGTQYFVSSHFVNTTEHSLAVWALTNTHTLNSDNPNLHLQAVAVDTQNYYFPTVPAQQKPGFHPLGESLGEPVEKIDTGDFRVQSAYLAGNRIWATLNTQVRNSSGKRLTGSAYFALVPSVQGRFISASVITQGIVSENDANCMYPAIAVNASQRGGMVFTLVGPNDYPSSAFVPVRGNSVGPITISREGREPEDGFTGYPEYTFEGNHTARWGDYSAAQIDENGITWLATEYTPDNARSSLANWSTYITRVGPESK